MSDSERTIEYPYNTDKAREKISGTNCRYVPGGKGALILDDPAPATPPTAEQLAARRKFIDEHVAAGTIKLPPLHWHEDDLIGRLLKGGDQ